MFRPLFATRKENKSARPTFRPMLETLEARDVPTTGVPNPIVTQVNAAIQEITSTLPNLQSNINANNPQNGIANFKVIVNDLNVLSSNAPKFAPSSRLQIDSTQVQTGVQLFQDGALLAQLGDPTDGKTLQSSGVTAFVNGMVDYLQMQGGLSNGNLTLS